MANNDINISINAKDGASGPIKSVEQHLEAMGKEAKETGSALRKFAAGGKAGAISMGALIGSLSEVGKMGAMASTAFRKVASDAGDVGYAMSKMSRSSLLSSGSMKELKDSTVGMSQSMNASSRSLEAQRKAAARMYDPSIKNSRVLTTNIGKLVDEQQGFKRSVELTNMASYYRDLEKSSAAADKLTQKVKPATRAVRKMGDETKKTKRDFSDLKDIGSDAAGHLKSVFNGVARVVRRSILVGVGAASVAMGALVRTGIRYNGQMQTYQVMMKTYLKDGKLAAKTILDAQQFAMKTPLDTKSVMGTVTRLVQYGATAESAMDTTKRLADVSAGSTEKMNLLGVAFAQVAAKGRLQAEEVRQLTNAGYNPLKSISQKTGESMGDLMDRMKFGIITVDEVTAALKRDTSAAVGANKAYGRFHGNVQALSKTLPGATANIKEMVAALAGDSTKGLYGVLTRSAVQTQYFLGILTDGVLEGKGWTKSIREMTDALRKHGGAGVAVAHTIDSIANSKFVNFAANFKKGVLDELSKGATFSVAIRRTASKTESGRTAVGMLDGAKSMLGALKPMLKGAMNFLGPLLQEIGKRVVKLIGSFREMAPLFTNVIGPLIKGVFKGILSVIDPILSAIAWLAPWIGKLGTAAKPLAPVFEKVGYVVGMFLGGPILAGIGKFAKGFGLIGKAVGPLGAGITKITGFVGKLTVGAARFVGRFIGGVGRLTVVFSGFFAHLGSKWFWIMSFPARMYLKFASFVLKMAGKFVGAIPRMANGFFNFVDKIGGRLGKMVQGFVRMMITGLLHIRSKFGSFANFIGTAIGHGVISIINGVIGQINKLFDGVEKLINNIPGVHVNMPTIGRVGGGGSEGGGGSAGSVATTPTQSVVIRQPAPAAGTVGGGTPFGPNFQSRRDDRDIVVQIDGKEIARATAKEIVRKRARA